MLSHIVYDNFNTAMVVTAGKRLKWNQVKKRGQ